MVIHTCVDLAPPNFVYFLSTSISEMSNGDEHHEGITDCKR